MKKQYKITTVGSPDIEKMSKAEQKSFYSSLLSLITEYYNTHSKVKTAHCQDAENDK